MSSSSSDDSFVELDNDYSINSYDSFDSYESVESNTSSEYTNEIENKN